MRIFFTLIISGLAFMQLSAQQSDVTSSINLSTRPQISMAVNEAADATPKVILESQGEVPQVRLYPNPAENHLQLIANERVIGSTIRIYNLLGSTVTSRSIGAAQEAIDISALQQGLYLYSVIDKNNKTVLTGKFNKQ